MSSINLVYDDSEPDSKGIALAVILTTIFLVVLFISTTVFYLSSIRKEQVAKLNTHYDVNRLAYESAQQKSLSTLKMLDKQSKTVQVPISVAMDYVVKSYQ